MIRRLLVVRHAHAAPAAPGGSDRERPLDSRGRRALASIATNIAELGEPVDIVLASTATRVCETVRGALPAGFDEGSIWWSDALYLAEVNVLLGELRGLPEQSGSVVLCGHNPGVHELVLALIAERISGELASTFAVGAVAALDIETNWSEVAPGCARLVALRQN